MRSDLEVFDQFAKYTRNGMDGFEIEVDACEKNGYASYKNIQYTFE